MAQHNSGAVPAGCGNVMTVVPLPTRRLRSSPRRRAPEIIEAAARVFAERGYHGATTQDIADVLRIRQASLYYYFPSKEVALELVCIHGVAGFFETALAILGMANGVAAWYGREDASIERIGTDFVRLVLAGIVAGKGPVRTRR